MNVKVQAESLDDLLNVVGCHDGVGYELVCLLALRDRVIRKTGLKLGGRAQLRRTISVEKSSGWWPVRPTLHKGAGGMIERFGFRHETGRPYCLWLPDVEWTRSVRAGSRWDHEHWITRPGQHAFMLWADELEPVA